MPRVLLRNHKVHYQQTGEGPDVVLVHGLSCNIAFWWFNVAEHLARSHRVTAIDLRGHGVSGMTETGYRPVDLAADVAALLDHIKVTGAHVIGHSFGGSVSAALAAQRPDLVAELTLAEAWVPALQPMAPLLGGTDWAATRARAEARGIEIDVHMPLVVRALYSELLDEIDFLDSDHDERVVERGAGHWEDAGRAAAGGQAAVGKGRRGLRFGALWSRPVGDDASPRPGWAPGTRQFFRRGAARFAQRRIMDQAAAMPDIAAAQTQKMTPEAREARMQVLRSALSITGKPGQPSQAVRRWHELMQNTQARREFLDTTGVDAPALRDIRGNVRLVYGARSAYRPTADALQDLLPEARLQIIPRAAHYFPLLRPQALLRALEDRFDPIAPHEMMGKPALRLVAQTDEAPLSLNDLLSTSPVRDVVARMRAPRKGTPGA